jgi:hypothetical protein
MLNRRAVLFLAAAAGCELVFPINVFGNQKPKRKPKNPDGKNDVVGAVWKVVATNAATQEEKTFGFRAKDGILYNGENETVGVIKPIKQGESLITLKAPSELAGELKITMQKFGQWSGLLKTKDGQEWRCRLLVKDR